MKQSQILGRLKMKKKCLCGVVVILLIGFVLNSALAQSVKRSSEEAMKVLITGFAPFGGEKINPSNEAVKMLPDKIDGAVIIKKELPVVFVKSINILDKYIKEYDPDIIICVGQAGGRTGLSVERVGINIDDARIPDNDKFQPIDEKIFKDGDNAYFASIPIKAIVQEMQKNGIPGSVSNTAGTYVCNHIMYGLLYLINKDYPGKVGGFIHVPYIPSQVVSKSAASMSLDDIAKGLEIAVETSIKYRNDLKITGGKED
jgi:pyroglutamyl-peptidase